MAEGSPVTIEGRQIQESHKCLRVHSDRELNTEAVSKKAQTWGPAWGNLDPLTLARSPSASFIRESWPVFFCMLCSAGGGKRARTKLNTVLYTVFSRRTFFFSFKWATCDASAFYWATQKVLLFQQIFQWTLLDPRLIIVFLMAWMLCTYCMYISVCLFVRVVLGGRWSLLSFCL